VAAPTFAWRAAQNLVNKSVEAFGRIDCLINNAGWHPPPKTIDEFSVEDMQDLYQLNFISCVPPGTRVRLVHGLASVRPPPSPIHTHHNP